MTNQEIIDNIKSKLTKDKEVDLPYLRCEFKIYQTMQNDEVMYAILQLIFKYLSNDTKEDLDTKTHEVLHERSKMYDDAVCLLNNNKISEALDILLKLISTYEKLDSAKVQNYFDFEQLIDYITYCETVEKAKKLNVKRYPEPVTNYTYKVASIYIKLGNYEEAIKHLKQALHYNPKAVYIKVELINLYEELGEFDKAFELIVDTLEYAYSKDQFAYLYEHLGMYFETICKFDIAVAAYFASDYYYNDQVNKNKIQNIISSVGLIKLDNTNDILSLFERENIKYGPSKKLIETIEEFIKYLKHLKDLDGVKYLLSIMADLTEDDYYLNQLKQLESVK